MYMASLIFPVNKAFFSQKKKNSIESVFLSGSIAADMNEYKLSLSSININQLKVHKFV